MIVTCDCNAEYNVKDTIPGSHFGIIVCDNCHEEIKVEKEIVEGTIVVKARPRLFIGPLVKSPTRIQTVLNFIKRMYGKICKS